MFELFNHIPTPPTRPVPAPLEFRRHDRQSAAGKVWLSAEGRVARGQLVDLSVEGALIATDLRLPPGAQVRLFYDLGDGRGPCAVTGYAVRRVEGGDGDGGAALAVRAPEPSPHNRERLARYIERLGTIGQWRTQYGL